MPAGVRFKEGSGGSGVGRRPGVRFKQGGLVQARCKVQGRFQAKCNGSGGSGVVWCRPGVRFKQWFWRFRV